MKSFHRLSLRTQFGILIAALIGVVMIAGTIVGHSLVVSQTMNEGRSVAQMVEHIGTWGARYGGVHVRGGGVMTASPGTFLERRVYAANVHDEKSLAGSRLMTLDDEMAALSRAESYYWKNPALIQREIGDISSASRTGARFRITAKSVFNPANAPNAFELEALNRIAADFQKNGSAVRWSRPLEYSRVEGDRLLYARSMVAGESCLRCHGTRESAPGFLRTNAHFTGGGFGYEAGKPAGVISVSIPLPPMGQALSASLTAPGWIALGAIVVVGVLLLWFVIHQVIAPVNRLRAVADTLASARLNQEFVVPPLGLVADGARSGNEVHRLAAAVARLARSLKYVYSRIHQNKP